MLFANIESYSILYVCIICRYRSNIYILIISVHHRAYCVGGGVVGQFVSFIHSLKLRQAGKRTARRAHRLHFRPLQRVLDAHMIAHRIRMRKTTAALQHRTDGTVARIVPIEMLAKNARLEWRLAQRAGQQVATSDAAAAAIAAGSCWARYGYGAGLVLLMLLLLLLRIVAADVASTNTTTTGNITTTTTTTTTVRCRRCRCGHRNGGGMLGMRIDFGQIGQRVGGHRASQQQIGGQLVLLVCGRRLAQMLMELLALLGLTQLLALLMVEHGVRVGRRLRQSARRTRMLMMTVSVGMVLELVRLLLLIEFFASDR